METTKPNTGRIDDPDANASDLLIMRDIEEEDFCDRRPSFLTNVNYQGQQRHANNISQSSTMETTKPKSGRIDDHDTNKSNLLLIMGDTEEEGLSLQEPNAKGNKAIKTISSVGDAAGWQGGGKDKGDCNENAKGKEEDDEIAIVVAAGSPRAFSLDPLMEDIEETTMDGVDKVALQDKCYDDQKQEYKANAVFQLEKKSPFLRKRDNKRLKNGMNFPPDCFSFLSLHGLKDNPIFFCFGMLVFVIQMSFLMLMVLSVIHKKWNNNGFVDNPGTNLLASFIAANSSPLVQATQILAIISFVLFADASFLDVATSIETFPTRSKDATRAMVVSCVLRFLQGIMAILVTLVLIVTSESVIEIVLNFTAVNFISYLDDVAFGLALQGKYGPRIEGEAKRITTLPLPACMTRGNKHVRFQFTLVTFGLILISIMIGIISAQTNSNVWRTKILRVEFQDKELKAHSGCYEMDQNPVFEANFYKRKSYKSSEGVLKNATFGYCIDEKRWKLFKNGTNACKADNSEVANSAKSQSFDVSTTFDQGWFSASGKPLDLYFIKLGQDLEGQCSSFDNGICNSKLNTFKNQYDGGDCCSGTCSRSNCGIDAVTEGFGMVNTTGSGFPQCKDPTMFPVTIYLDTFASNKELIYLAQRFTPQEIENFERGKHSCNGKEECAFDHLSADPINPSLRLECDNQMVLLIDINPNMTNHTETVFVKDGANCTMGIANRANPGVEELIGDPAIWYVNLTIFQGRSADSETKILEMNSGEQGASSFFRIPSCMFQKLSLYTDTTGMYSDNYKLMALKWMMEDSSGSSDCLDKFFKERFALSVMNFYAPITGNKEPLWIQASPHCLWPMIDCDNGVVSALNLNSKTLAGKIPSEIGLLSSLQTLNFQGNSLTGKIPTEIGLSSSLESFYLNGNSLTGAIPTEIGLLSSLQKLDFYGNSLTGVLPTEIGLLSSLQLLVFYGNNVTGVIPSEIGALSTLHTLDFHGNGLTGAIPTEIGLLSSLHGLAFFNNSLTGVLPTEIGLLASLQRLNFCE